MALSLSAPRIAPAALTENWTFVPFLFILQRCHRVRCSLGALRWCERHPGVGKVSSQKRKKKRKGEPQSTNQDQVNRTFAEVDEKLDFGGQENYYYYYFKRPQIVVTLYWRRTASLSASVLNHTGKRRNGGARCEMAWVRFGREKWSHAREIVSLNLLSSEPCSCFLFRLLPHRLWRCWLSWWWWCLQGFSAPALLSALISAQVSRHKHGAFI